MYKQQFTVPEKFEFYISTVYDVKNTYCRYWGKLIASADPPQWNNSSLKTSLKQYYFVYCFLCWLYETEI